MSLYVKHASESMALRTVSIQQYISQVKPLTMKYNSQTRKD